MQFETNFVVQEFDSQFLYMSKLDLLLQISVSLFSRMKPQKQDSPSQKPKVNFSYQSNTSPQVQQQLKQPISLKPKPPAQTNINAYPVQQQQQQMPMQMQMPIQMQYQQQMNNFDYPMNSYLGYGYSYEHGDGTGVQIRLLNKSEEEKDKKVVAVIVSFFASSTYDSLFTSVQQKSQEGTKVLVYSCTSEAVDVIYKEFKGEDSKNETAKELVRHIKELDADCVVFNWECSAGYTSQTFPQGRNHLFDFVKFVLDRGHMAMFSDFSLKSLINEWDSTKLGPNPFKKISETSAPFELGFDREKLMDCPSAQLQVVGQMAEKGRCHVEVMGGTIVYSADKRIKKNDFYTMEILTVAETDQPCSDQHYKLQVNGHKGTAGHVLLTYKSGGHLLTSMGHWIELMKIDTSEHKLFEIAQKQYGAGFAEQMKYQYAQMDVQQQRAFVSQNAVNFVQNSVPCKSMASKNYQKKM